jgi:dipeptidyl-peptidase-4
MIDSNAWNLLTPGRPVHVADPRQGVDPAGEWAYFVSTRGGPLERQIDRVNIADGRIEQVSAEPGFHAAALSGDGRYLVDQFSDVNTPPVTRITAIEDPLQRADGSGSAVLAECAGPSLDLPDMTREFITVKAHDGTDLHAQLVKPEGFDPANKYPVVVHWYGGSGLQTVSNRYGTTNIFNIIERDVLYTQAGFLVWRLDNRGSFGRGHAFETPVFGELGKRELDDQLAGIEYLKTLPFVDGDRIGTDGKSFGGYMTLYALIHAPAVFRCGVSGAPPTDWRYYDTIYTERYMRTPQANPEGYAATNLVEQAGQIWAAPLLIHGLADTNVHLQNTVNFIQALEENDRLFEFVPLPNLSHSFKGDGLVAALMASVDYLSRCFAAPAPTAPPAAAPPAAAPPAETAAAWQTYTDTEAGFSIQYPSTWTSEPLPDQNDAALHGTAFTGPEGGVEVYWGAGFGGACPEGTEPMQLAEVETTACHATTPQGTDTWSQIYYQVDGGNAFAVNAYTSNTNPDSRDLVLQVLATLTFMPPAEPETGATAIQPLSMEVCDGQAQAMAHALDVLEVTQDEAPLDDPVTGASGTGCQATVTGTGEQFGSPDAPLSALGSMLEAQGWTLDPMLAAGGPTGVGQGYRKGDQICWASAQWQPDAATQCPADQPISACEVPPEHQAYTVILNCGVETVPGKPAARRAWPILLR